MIKWYDETRNFVEENMQINVDVLDNTNTLEQGQLSLAEKLAQFVAVQENIEAETEVTISFVTNDLIQEMNRDYRGKDVPTDVLSFSMEELGEEEIEIILEEDMPRVLGDIVISVDKMKEQAAEFDHSENRELGFLVVHGMLHLLGYDHLTDEDEKIMFAKQNELLDAYGLQR